MAAGGTLTGYKYQRYVASTHWAERKKAYYATHPRKCAACRTGKNIHLHHKRYDNVWNEPDCDLIPLCERCHSEVHRRHVIFEKKLSLAEVTDNYIRVMTATLKRKRERERATKTREPRERVGPLAPKPEQPTGKVGRMSGIPVLHVDEEGYLRRKPKKTPPKKKTRKPIPATTTTPRRPQPTQPKKKKKKKSAATASGIAMRKYWAESQRILAEQNKK